MIAIDNLNGSGGNVDLTGIYKQLNNLNQSVSDLESLTGLSSLSNDIWSLNTNLDAAWENITAINEGITYAMLPMILDNSSAIDSLSSSITNINSSLAALQQSCSDITNSLSTLTGGGGLLTNSTFNYQAFNTTYNLAPKMYLTGNFDLNNASSLNGNNGIWNLSHLERKMFSWLTLSSFSQITFNDIATFWYNTFKSINKFNFNCCSDLQYQYFENIYNLNLNNDNFMFYGTVNTCTYLKFDSCRSIETCKFTSILNFDINCGRYIKSNSFNNITNIDIKNVKSFEDNKLTVSHGNFENCAMSYCDFTATNANFNNCSLTLCGITPEFAQFENCFISKCGIDIGKRKEFKNVSFSDNISFWSSANLSFNNIDFSTDNFKFMMYHGKFRIYIHNCLIKGSTTAAAVFQNMFSNADNATFEFVMF